MRKAHSRNESPECFSKMLPTPSTAYSPGNSIYVSPVKSRSKSCIQIYESQIMLLHKNLDSKVSQVNLRCEKFLSQAYDLEKRKAQAYKHLRQTIKKLEQLEKSRSRYSEDERYLEIQETKIFQKELEFQKLKRDLSNKRTEVEKLKELIANDKSSKDEIKKRTEIQFKELKLHKQLKELTEEHKEFLKVKENLQLKLKHLNFDIENSKHSKFKHNYGQYQELLEKQHKKNNTAKQRIKELQKQYSSDEERIALAQNEVALLSKQLKAVRKNIETLETRQGNLFYFPDSEKSIIPDNQQSTKFTLEDEIGSYDERVKTTEMSLDEKADLMAKYLFDTFTEEEDYPKASFYDLAHHEMSRKRNELLSLSPTKLPLPKANNRSSKH